jgi:polyisoprenoid-binding protein YceI
VRFAVTALVAALPMIAGAQQSIMPDVLDFEPNHSSVLFTARFLQMVRVAGRFTQFDGAIAYDSLAPERSGVTAVIHVASLNTDNAERDTHLKSGDFLDAERFPTITFYSTRVERKAGGFVAVGPLTVHGVTKEISIPFTQVLPRRTTPEGGVEIAFVGMLSLKRQDFGVVGGNKYRPAFNLLKAAIGDSVDVVLNVFATRFDVRGFPFTNTPKPSIGELMLATDHSKGARAAVAQYEDLKTRQPNAYNFTDGELDLLAYKLMLDGQVQDAIAILTLCVQEFPDSSNDFDSLGEAYARAGDRTHAIESYRRAVALDSTNTDAMEVLRALTASR